MQEYPSSSMSSSNPPDAEMWQAYWREQGQPWRSEPIIDEERQQRLLSYAQGGVDIERGRYPFKGVRLSRADIEWLLAMQEQRSAQERAGGGTRGKQQKSFGLDVRGADLSGVNLRDLPLMRLHAGLSLEEGRHATTEPSAVARGAIELGDVGRSCAGGVALGRG